MTVLAIVFGILNLAICASALAAAHFDHLDIALGVDGRELDAVPFIAAFFGLNGALLIRGAVL